MSISAGRFRLKQGDTFHGFEIIIAPRIVGGGRVCKWIDGYAAAHRTRAAGLAVRGGRLGQDHEHGRLRWLLDESRCPAPGLLSNIVPFIEFGMGVCLILGLATRYAAIVVFLFCLIATALAHRYWEYPAAQQAAQYTNFLKGIAFMGASLIVLVTGAGKFSVDAALAKNNAHRA